MTSFDRRTLISGLAGAAALSPALALAQSPHDVPAATRRRFEGKVVAITGATSGIGRAAAFAFAREGAKVGFCGRREALGRAVEAGLRANGAEALYIRADVREPDQAQRFVDGIAQRFGGLDVGFNNAGINWFKPLHEMSVADWVEMAETNTRGVFLAMKYQIPHLLRRGGGTIVITGSFHQEATRPGGSAYAASKRAAMGLCQAATLDYGTKGIRVNILEPGIVNTRLFTDRLTTKAERDAAAATVDGLKRVSSPEEQAEAALFLASNDCPYLTGTSLLVDGGSMAGI